MSPAFLLGSVVGSALLCLIPLGPARVLGAIALVCLLPGWCLWQALDETWPTRKPDLRLVLAFLGSGALTPLTLYWACYGRLLTAPVVGAALVLVCVALIALSLLRQTPTTQASAVPGLPWYVRLGLAAVCVVFAALVLWPWAGSGRDLAGLVNHSPCSGDWSAHRAVTYALLDTGVPPRNPFLCYKPLTYYYGHYLEAAALVRLSGGALSVEAALALLSALLAVATCLLVFHLVWRLFGSAPAALGAATLTVLVGGLDVGVLAATRYLLDPYWWNLGHAGVWTLQPRLPFAFSNLHWSPHHHMAALIALATLARLGETKALQGSGASAPKNSSALGGLGWLAVPLGGILVGGVVVNSIYLGMVVLGALALLQLWRLLSWLIWRRETAASVAGPILIAVLGVLLASGILLEVSRMVGNDRRSLQVALPCLPVAEELLKEATTPAPSSERIRYFMRTSDRVTREPSTVDCVAGAVAVPLQLGLIGLLGFLGLVRRRAGWVPAPLLCLLLSAGLVAVFVKNFDLQIRAGGLLWLVLGVYAGRYLTRARLRWPMWVLVGVLTVVGVGSVLFEVAGMSRPVYFDAQDVHVFSWVRDHTPPQSVVQAYPFTSPRVAWMPTARYFVLPSFPEFTGRGALLGDRSHIAMYELPPTRTMIARKLAAAFSAKSAEESARAFSRMHVDYVLWTSGDELSAHAEAKRLLLDTRHFRLEYRDGDSFVVSPLR
ncbi:MAG: hypothetical protein ABFE16_09000 [Armatimonadia bacterium]